MDALEDIAESLNFYLESKFGFRLQKTQIFLYSDKEWINLNLEENLGGFYRTRDLSVHLNKDSPYLFLNFLHEYFGHGLFFKSTKCGKEIQSADSLGAHLLTKENLSLIEGFAVWTEHYLSGLTGKEKQFMEKVEKMPKGEIELLKKSLAYENLFTDFGVMYSAGMPKFYNNQIIQHILKSLFKDRKVEFAILYGSMKPQSDIDLFVVSDEINSMFNNWLDMHSLSKQKFEYELSHLDIEVTDPLFSGEFLMGDYNYYNYCKDLAIKCKINNDTIQHNLRCSEEQDKYAKMFAGSEFALKRSVGYMHSYFKNAEELANGNKRFTRNALFA